MLSNWNVQNRVSKTSMFVGCRLNNLPNWCDESYEIVHIRDANY